jgi:hypothetical protein
MFYPDVLPLRRCLIYLSFYLVLRRFETRFFIICAAEWDQKAGRSSQLGRFPTETILIRQQLLSAFRESKVMGFKSLLV